MTIHLSSAVVHGHISNEIPGLITGSLHLAGRAQPLTLQFDGNFLRDIAGCRIEFSNPVPEAVPDQLLLSSSQTGNSGEMTASRRILRTPRRTRPRNFPATGLKNLLFFEWFNAQNQRVLIQSWHWSLRVSAPVWQLPHEIEHAQIKRNRKLRKKFLFNQPRGSSADDAFRAPTLNDPFAPFAPVEDPFAEHVEALPPLDGRHEMGKLEGSSPAMSAKMTAMELAAELRALESFLSNPPALRRHDALLDLFASIVDLAAQLRQTMFQLETLRADCWSHLVTDVEQSIPLFVAAAAACETLLQEPGMNNPMWWNTACQRLKKIVCQSESLVALLRTEDGSF